MFDYSLVPMVIYHEGIIDDLIRCNETELGNRWEGGSF
jgi:hypothetical protein